KSIWRKLAGPNIFRHYGRILIFYIPFIGDLIMAEDLQHLINKIKTEAVDKIAVYSLASQCNHWDNAQLLKECGLIPFMLHKNFGCKAVLVGENMGDYSYLSHLPGLEMDFIPSSNGCLEALISNQINYINENHQKMDALILRGLYHTTCFILQAYKQKRPNGKVYLYLDANGFWMDNIPWKEPLYYNSLSNCDLISTSCYKMTEFLNKKWPDFIIEHIPNGFLWLSSPPNKTQS
ncbi:MAG: hypothetical protein FWH22_00120, partial [Fibromonadales bacterium]|nr:hypothetical protein [Fibromonadales bacterium]